MFYGAMVTLGMMYPVRGGLVWGQMKGGYLKSGGLHPLGPHNILLIYIASNKKAT